MVHPDASAVITPTISLTASSIAALFHKANPTPCIRRTIMPMHVIRRAADELIRIGPAIAPTRATSPATVIAAA
jgi:hypothetical protein